MRLILGILMIAYMFYPVSANTEPNTTTRYLMNEPLSMLDFGLYILEKSIERNLTKAEYEKIFVFTNYDWNRNRIVIQVLINDSYNTENEGKEVCRSILNEIREQFAINHKTGKPRIEKIGSTISSYFSHEGYTNNNEPKEFNLEIANITTIVVDVILTENSKVIHAEGELLSSKIMFADE